MLLQPVLTVCKDFLGASESRSYSISAKIPTCTKAFPLAVYFMGSNISLSAAHEIYQKA